MEEALRQAQRDAPGTLGTPLLRQREWQWEGITVLTARAELPQLSGSARRVRRFNAYYAHMAEAFFAHCARRLLPEARESCRAAMARSAPWERPEWLLCCRVTYADARFLSLLLTLSGAGEARHFGEVWDASALLPVPLAEWLGGRAKRRLLQQATHTSPFRPGGRSHGYCLTEDGAAVQLFLPSGQVMTHALAQDTAGKD